MTIEQTVEIPASHRLTIKVPREVPAGKTILAFTPAPADQDIGMDGECHLDHTPNAETAAAIREGRAMMRGEIPAHWHHGLEDLDKILGIQAMLDYEFAGSFKKDLKRIEKRRMDMRRLREVMRWIITEQPSDFQSAPPRCQNHPLHGEWEGSLDCHIQGDWVLIYEIDSAAKTVVFHRTGTHSDLF